MRLQCPECRQSFAVDAAADRRELSCPYCLTRFDPRGEGSLVARPEPADRDSPPPPPVVISVGPARKPGRLVREQAEDLREDREERRERRRHRREDRATNFTGVAGFALCATAALLVLSGLVFHQRLTVYAWMAGVFSVPLALIGVVLSLVGSTLRGRDKALALAGAVLGGLLVLGLIPFLFLLLTDGQ